MLIGWLLPYNKGNISSKRDIPFGKISPIIILYTIYTAPFDFKSLNLCPRGFQIQRCLFNDWVQNLNSQAFLLYKAAFNLQNTNNTITLISLETLIYQGFRHYTENHLPINLTLSIDGNGYGTPDWVRTSDLQSRSLGIVRSCMLYISRPAETSFLV